MACASAAAGPVKSRSAVTPMSNFGIIAHSRWMIALVAAFGAFPAFAASINYGNFGPVAPGVTFIGVTEEDITDPLPIFGSPGAYSIGLDFDPVGFVAYGSAGASDTTAGRLKFTLLSSMVGMRMDTIGLAEAGDYTKIGTGTAATSVSATAIIEASVTEINGVAVAPIVLTPVNAATSFALPGNAVVQPWSLGVLLNVQTQLIGLGYTANDAATRIDVTLTNTLNATSELSSAASIAKKDFRVDVQVTNFIPEPGSLMLAAAACSVLLARRR